MDLFFVLTVILITVLYFLLSVKKPGISLLLYLPVCIALFFFGIQFFDENLFIGGFSIAAAVIVFFTTPLCVWLWGGDPYKDRSKRIVGKWILLTYATCSVLLLLFPAALSLIGVYFFFFIFFFAASIATFVKSSKTATDGFILTTIGTSLRQNLPLPAALRAAAPGQPASRRYILEQISDWLTKGFSLADALENGYPKFPIRFLSQIRVAERINQLPQAFQSMENDLVKQAQENSKVGPVKPMLYIGLVFVITSLLVTGLTFFVLPKYTDVLTQMGIKLPLATKLLLDFSNFVWFETKGLLVIGIFLIFGLYVIFNLKARFVKRNPQKPPLITRIKDMIRWHTPFMHWFELNYSALILVQLLKNSVKAGIPTAETFQNSIELDTNYCFKSKLIEITKRLYNGHDLADSVIKCKLPKSIAWAYRSSTTQQGLEEVLQMLEDFYRSNYSYRVNLARQIFSPISIIVIGSFVGFVCYAIFVPSVEMIKLLVDLVP